MKPDLAKLVADVKHLHNILDVLETDTTDKAVIEAEVAFTQEVLDSLRILDHDCRVLTHEYSEVQRACKVAFNSPADVTIADAARALAYVDKETPKKLLQLSAQESSLRTLEGQLRSLESSQRKNTELAEQVRDNISEIREELKTLDISSMGLVNSLKNVEKRESVAKDSRSYTVSEEDYKKHQDILNTKSTKD